jgi:hypothetical protein
MMFRAVFWVVLPFKMIVDRRFRGAYCLHHQGSGTSETSVDNHFTRQYIPEDNSEQIIDHFGFMLKIKIRFGYAVCLLQRALQNL